MNQFLIYEKRVFLSYYTNTVPGISSTLHRYCMHVTEAVLEEGENREIHISSQSFSFVDFLLTALQPIRIFGPVKNSSELVRGFLVRVLDFHIGHLDNYYTCYNFLINNNTLTLARPPTAK